MRVIRCIDLYTAVEHDVTRGFERIALLLLEVCYDLFVDIFGKVTVNTRTADTRRRLTEDKLCIQRTLVFCLGDHHQLIHLGQDDALAAQGVSHARLGPGIVDRRPLRDTGEEGRFFEAELRGVLIEVGLGGGLDTYVGIRHRDEIQVEFHDLVIRQRLLELNRVVPLLHLTGGGDLVLTGEHLDGLLRDGRAAVSRRTAVGQRRDDRARDTSGVDTDVVVEALILDSDEGLVDIGMLHFVDGDIFAIRITRTGRNRDDLAVRAIHGGGLGTDRQEGRIELTGRGEVSEEHTAADAADEEDDRRQKQRRNLQNAAHQTAGNLAWRL